MDQPYRNRQAAGKRLALELEGYRESRPVVLGLPRGGVPVAYEVAEHLGAPLDVFVVRKLGVPGHEELAMGAIASGGAMVLNREVLQLLHIPHAVLEDVAQREASEVIRRDALYRSGAPLLDLEGRTVLLIDDGLATGATMRAALATVRLLQPVRLVAAVPIAAPEACASLRDLADDVVCAQTPEPFHAVGLWYRSFEPTTDEEVQYLLAANRERVNRALRHNRAS